MLVSYFHFARALIFCSFTGNFELFVRLFLNNKLWYGSWWEHVKEYVKIPNIHIIQYEELLEVLVLKNFFKIILKCLIIETYRNYKIAE